MGLQSCLCEYFIRALRSHSLQLHMALALEHAFELSESTAVAEIQNLIDRTLEVVQDHQARAMVPAFLSNFAVSQILNSVEVHNLLFSVRFPSTSDVVRLRK